MELAKQKRPKNKKSAPNGEIPVALTIDELLAEENKDLEKSLNEKDHKINDENLLTCEEKLTEFSTPLNEPAECEEIGKSKTLNFDDREKQRERDRQQSVELTDLKHIQKTITTLSIYPSTSELMDKSTQMSKTEEAIVFNKPQILIDQSHINNGIHHYPQLSTQIYSIAFSAPLHNQLMNNESEMEFMDEHRLQEFYHNEELEFVNEFLDVFIKKEQFPRNCLHDLLASYKLVCEQIQSNDDTKNAKVRETRDLNNRVWSVSEQKIIQQGRCGCQRNATGEIVFNTAEMHPELLVQLKDAMDCVNDCELDAGFCQCIRAKSLALQIQWEICVLRDQFFIDLQLRRESQNTFLNKTHGPSANSRQAIRGALSDLFYFNRFPMLPQRFQQALVNWIIELGSILLKSCTTNDQLFLLSQILRSPSPLGDTISLVQTFLTTPMLDYKLPLDNFMVMLKQIMRPIKSREQFIAPIIQYFESENGWNLINEDGDMDKMNLTEINENDYIDLLIQFPFRTLIGIAIRHFTLIQRGNRIEILYSLISFITVLLKILDEGLQTHIEMKNLSKRITYIISKVLHYFCEYWRLISSELLANERHLLQNEINRIVLTAVYFVVTKKNLIIRQFLVDYPYATISENTRQLCQILLRTSPRKKIPTIQELLKIPRSDLLEQIRKGGTLADQLTITSQENEHIYTVTALASIISHSEQDQLYFVTEIVNICFLNEYSREKFYKVGSEAITILIQQNPSILAHLIRFIDHNVDHLDDYAINILNNAPLNKCVLSIEDMNILGKWLIQRPVDSPVSTIARRILSSMDWSDESPLPNQYQCPSKLLSLNPKIHQDVHNICAEMIVKAHLVHCKQRNNLISKPLNKISRLATKCPDMEHIFDKFCWEVLLKLKISKNPNAPIPPNDLTAFYVHCIQKSVLSLNDFIETGLHYFQQLVNSTCYIPATIILKHAIFIFSSQIHLLIEKPSFVESIEQLFRADDSSSYASYAFSFFASPNKFPGPVLRFISSAISYQINVEMKTFEQRKQIVNGWLQVLTSPKTLYKWNEEKAILHLIGICAKCAIIFDPNDLFDSLELLTNRFKTLCRHWKEANRGPLSWFSSSNLPPLIAATNFAFSPWATYLLLRTEQKAFSEFYDQLYTSIGKYPSRSLIEAIKRASSRSNINLNLDQLAYYRWLQLCCCDELFCNNIPHNVLQLAVQQLAMELFTGKQYQGRKFCPGWHFFHTKESEHQFAKFHTRLKNASSGINSSKNGRKKSAENFEISHRQSLSEEQKIILIDAFSKWMTDERCYKPESSMNYEDLPLDYLFQMIVSGDQQLWTEFIDMNELKTELERSGKIFAKFCQLNFNASSNPSSPQLVGRKCITTHFANLTQFFSALEQNNVDKFSTNNNDIHRPFPSVPLHQNLPMPDKLNLKSTSGLFQLLNPFSSKSSGETISRFFVNLDELNNASRLFIITKEFVEKSNIEYVEHFQYLYKQTEKKMPITLRCGNLLQTSRCARPLNTEILVKPCEYQQSIAEKMDVNRQKRQEESTKLLSRADSLAIVSARIEHICSCLEKMVKSPTLTDDLLCIGLELFYRVCTSIETFQLLFQAGKEVYEICLNKLGTSFIANNSAEQLKLMRVILGRTNPLSHLLVEYFTPQCVQPQLLVQLYGELSNAVRQPATAEYALSLLRRLDIGHAGRQLPPNQFHDLMPIMFENLASVTGNKETQQNPLREICMNHFVHTIFHQFPHNFADGLKLILSGCVKQCIPTALFDEIARKLSIERELKNDFQVNNTRCGTPECRSKILMQSMNTTKALECVRLISQQFIASRRELGSRFFAIWAQYLEKTCQLADFLLRYCIRLSFQSGASTAAMEKGLYDAFQHCIEVWSPLLEPVPISNLQAWGIGDINLAEKVLEQLCRYILWLPYTLYIPPGRECPESLFWNYFSTKLVQINLKNTAEKGRNCNLKHIYGVYENKIISLNWSRFWPNLLDFSSMDQMLGLAKDQNEIYLAPIISEILVRLPWPNIIQQYSDGFQIQPLEAIRAFFSLIISIFGKCLHRKENYSRSRASMGNRLKYLYDNCQWFYVKTETLDKLGVFLVNESEFPFRNELFGDASSADDAQHYFLQIWSKACHFSDNQMFLSNAEIFPKKELEIARKRAIYVRTQLHLLLKYSNEIEKFKSHFVELLNKANSFLISAEDKVSYLDMTSEFIRILANYHSNVVGTTKEKQSYLEQIYFTICKWLNENVYSPFVLLFATITTTALKTMPTHFQHQFGLGIVECCIGAYFERGGVSQQWSEIAQWVRIQENIKEQQLFNIPKSDSTNDDQYFLILNAILTKELSEKSSNNLKLIKRLAEYFNAIRPKHVLNNESAFLLCIEKWQRMCIQLFSDPGISLSVAYENFDQYLVFIQRIYKEDSGKGSGFFSIVTQKLTRKPTYSNRLQLFVNVLHLFITQQLTSPTQLPRIHSGQHVFNSRLSAFQELQNQKANIEFSGVLAEMAQYFTNATEYCLTDANELFRRFIILIFPQKFVQQIESIILEPFDCLNSSFFTM